MKRLLPVLSILVLILSGGQTTGGNDKDWNVNFYDNCGMPKNDSMQWIEEGGNKFIRFQLRDKDYGQCSTDRVARHGAPYWERAELKQNSKLSPNTKYQVRFKVRFVQGFKNLTTFFQIHAHNSPCWAYPPIMLKISEVLLVSPLNGPSGRGSHYNVFTDIKIADLVGHWNTLTLTFDTSIKPVFTLHLNEKEIVPQTSFYIESCGAPHFKFGLYRPGNEFRPNTKSVIDFDDMKLTIIEPNYHAPVSCLKIGAPISISKIYSGKTCKQDDKKLNELQLDFLRDLFSTKDLTNDEMQESIDFALESLNSM